MATAKQASNDIDPEGPLDWRQGYGFQFWRCQHNAYRGDGAFGQFCLVMPEQDAVLAITSGVADMQAVLNLVWKHILPAMGSAPLPQDPAAQRKLSARLADLCLDPPAGAAAPGWVGHRAYRLDDNPLDLRSLRMDSAQNHFDLVFEGAGERISLQCGMRSWVMGRSSFLGMDRMHGSSTPPGGYPVAAACAWTAGDTLEIQAHFHETPFCYTITCQFTAEQVRVLAKVNVSFGPTESPALVGHLA